MQELKISNVGEYLCLSDASPKSQRIKYQEFLNFLILDEQSAPPCTTVTTLGGFNWKYIDLYIYSNATTFCDQ